MEIRLRSKLKSVLIVHYLKILYKMIPKDAEKPVDGRMKTRNKQEENHGI